MCYYVADCFGHVRASGLPSSPTRLCSRRCGAETCRSGQGSEVSAHHVGRGTCRRKGRGPAGDTPQAETCQPGQATIAVPGVEGGVPRAGLAAETERARQADFRLAHRFVSEHDAVIVETSLLGTCSDRGCGPVRCRNRDGRPSMLCWNTKLGKLVSGSRR